MDAKAWKEGGCHCKRVRFKVALAARIEVEDCNCSICLMSQNAHIIVPASNFELIKGEKDLITYTFNTGVAQHLFCRYCGVKSFYIPRSNPDGRAVTWRCLDNPNDFESVQVNQFDGVHWEANAAVLSHKSKN